MDYLQIAAFCYLMIYYGVLLGLRVYLLHKKTGINPIKIMERKGLAGFIERVFMICFILVSLIVLNFVFTEPNYIRYLIPIPYLETTFIVNLGIVLGLSGLILAMIPQSQMGDSWRLGINAGQKTKLITQGLYKYSRNPVYLGLLISYFGFVAMMPNALSIVFLVLSYFALEVKIKLEENHLESVHLDVFKNYKRSVRRWI